MTLTLQLGIFLSFVIPGFLVQVIVTFRTYGRYAILNAFAKESDLHDATLILLVVQAIQLASWSVGLAIGLAALFDTTTSPPVGQTLIGQLILIGLLLFFGLLMVGTLFGFFAGEWLNNKSGRHTPEADSLVQIESTQPQT